MGRAIDPSTARVTATIVTGRGIHSLAATSAALWVTNQRDGTVSVIDTDTAELVATSPIGDTPGGLAVGHDAVWLVPHRDVVVLRLDPTTPLEAAAQPDIARAVDVSSGTMYLRCSGVGSPTVVLEADASYGAGSWALVEAAWPAARGLRFGSCRHRRPRRGRTCRAGDHRGE